jgi:hypothetical protein
MILSFKNGLQQATNYVVFWDNTLENTHLMVRYVDTFFSSCKSLRSSFIKPPKRTLQSHTKNGETQSSGKKKATAAVITWTP